MKDEASELEALRRENETLRERVAAVEAEAAALGARLAGQRALDEALRRSEQRYRLATEAVSGLVYDYDAGSDTVDRSAGLYDIVGYHPDEVPATGAWWNERIHPDDLRRAYATFVANVERGARVHETEYRVRHRDGSWRHVWDRGVILRDGGGRILRQIGCTIDITARKQAEDALRDADRRKDEFLAVLGHELRNPLAPILAVAQLLRLRGFDRELDRELATIERHVGQAIALVDDLLDVSRVARGKLELRRERLELGEVVRQALEATSLLVEQRGHRCSIDVAAEGLAVDGDRVRLVQIVVNLVANAARYTAPGGHLELAARRDGDAIELTVADDGPGLSPAVAARAFEPFVQGDRGHRGGGLGLGLAIVRGLTELHGGQVAFDGDRPRGTCVRVRLPASTITAPAPVAAAAVAPRVGSLSILLVDDNEDLADMLGLALRRLGHRVEVVHDSLEALRVAPGLAVDVAVLDIGLPVLDGFELARRLRQLERARGLRLVAMSGYGQPSDRERAREVGFDAYLVKPVSVEALTGALGAPVARG